MSVRDWLFAVGATLLATQAVAQQPMETVEVVATTPLGGAVDLDQVASNVQAATSEDMGEQRTISLAEFMNRNFGSVFVNEAQGNPLQPDLQFRGYVGSPLLGLPQGIAVYQDGARVNEPFGDTVNWALIPDSAIDTVYLMPGSNPLFGLNALGGALSIQTKTGFTHPGTRAEALAGSFARVGVEVETGGSLGDTLSYFATAAYLEEDGWRDFSPTEAGQLFASLAWKSADASLDARLTHADTDLIGNGAAPIQLLDRDREAIFTRPDQTTNALTMLNLSGSRRLSDALTLTGNLYLRDSDVTTLNGDEGDFDECGGAPGFVCEQDDGGEGLILDQNGNAIPVDDTVEGATVNRTATEQDGIGFGIQANWTSELAAGENLFVLGVAYDDSEIVFDASTELGALDATRQALPSGFFVGESFTRLNAEVTNTGFYFSNVVTISEAISISVSGRYNKTEVALRDQLGTALSGNHAFNRFNPGVGLTVDVSDDLSFYAGYTESNRAPSPVELTCADENDPCRLPNAFLADPPLKDVVAKTFEAGVRGEWRGNRWHAGAFRASNEDDILFISAGALTNEGFFDNVGRTRRDGIELSAHGNTSDRFTWFANYTFLKATFGENFAVASPNNPKAIAGEIVVNSGDRLPLIPSHLFKAGFRVMATARLNIGADILARSGTYFRGDEGNAASKVGGYAIVNLGGDYSINENIRPFFSIHNVFDSDHETFGLFGDAAEVLGDEFDDSRFLSPGMPRAAWVGLRVAF